MLPDIANLSLRCRLLLLWHLYLILSILFLSFPSNFNHHNHLNHFFKMTSFRFRASVLLLAFAATGAFSRAVSSVPGGRPILQDAEGMSSSSQASASAASASASASATATATSTATDIVVKTLVKTTTITLHPYGNRPRPTEAAKSTIFLAVKPDGDVHTLPSHEWVDKYGPPDVEDESIPDDFAGSGIYPDPPPLPWELPWKRSESAPKDLSHEALNEMRKHLDVCIS